MQISDTTGIFNYLMFIIYHVLGSEIALGDKMKNTDTICGKYNKQIVTKLALRNATAKKVQLLRNAEKDNLIQIWELSDI